MKRTIIAVALLAVAGAANAGLYCKNDEGQSFKWSIGDPRPVDSANFKMSPNVPIFNTKSNNGVVCFVNAQLYRDMANNVLSIRAFPIPAGIDQSAVSETTYGENSAGVVYRGDQARWLIDNLPSAYGDYATRAYYNTINP